MGCTWCCVDRGHWPFSETEAIPVLHAADIVQEEHIDKAVQVLGRALPADDGRVIISPFGPIPISLFVFELEAED